MRWVVGLLAVLLLGLAGLFASLPQETVERERIPVDAPPAPDRERPRRAAHPPGSDSDPDAEEVAHPTEKPVFVLRAVDGAGEPLRGVPFVPFFDDTRYTDPNGEIAFDGPPAGGLRTPLCHGDVELDGPLTIVRLVGLCPVEVRFVDLETAAPLDVTWPSGAQPVGWARPGESVKLHLPVGVPQGWVWPDAYRSRYMGRTSRYVDRFVATIPVPREARLRVRVQTSDGSPAGGALVTVRGSDWTRNVAASAWADERGVAEVRGFPFRRRDEVRVTAEWRVEDSFEKFRREHRLQLPEANQLVESALRLPPEPIDDFEGPSSSGTIGIGGGAGLVREGPRTASLRVQIVRRDGTPGSGAKVYGSPGGTKEAGEDGVLIFEDLPPGPFTVRVHETGIVPVSATVKLVEEQRSSVVLHEADGRTLIVRVVDSTGPLVGANIHVYDTHSYSEWSFANVVDGVQQLHPLTDATGSCRLVDLPHDGIAILAVYGSRSVKGLPGTEGTLQLTMPDADED